MCLLRLDRISLGAGLPNTGLILQRDDLVRALAPELADLSEDQAGG